MTHFFILKKKLLLKTKGNGVCAWLNSKMSGSIKHSKTNSGFVKDII